MGSSAIKLAALQTRAILLIQQSNWKDAAADFEEILQIKSLSNNDKRMALHGLAISLYRSDIVMLSESLKLFDVIDDSDEIRCSKGVALLLSRDLKKAEENFANSNLPEAKFNHALIHFRQENFGACLKMLELIERNPELSHLSRELTARIFLIRLEIRIDKNGLTTSFQSTVSF